MKLVWILPVLMVFTVMPLAFAEVLITPTHGSGAPGCEDTSQGCYLPNQANVSIGETVVFKNSDTAAHTFTSGFPDEGPDGLFDTNLLMVNNSFEFTPETSRDIPYFCMVHPWMQGLIVVGEGSGTIPAPTPEPVIDDPLEAENKKLKNKIMGLKLENKLLKNEITLLNSEINSLKDQIVSMTKEFVDALQQLNEWFRSHLN